MPRPALWHKQSFLYGDGEGSWTRDGFEVREVRGYNYSWILTDPSRKWQIGYPHRQGGQNRKRAFPRAWANKRIVVFWDCRTMYGDACSHSRFLPEALAACGWEPVGQLLSWARLVGKEEPKDRA